MGELCIRWAMRVGSGVPLTPDGAPLRQIDTAVLNHWLRGSIASATPAFVAVAKELMDLSDERDLSRLSTTFLAKRLGFAETTVRGVLRKLANAGQRLTEAERPDG